MLRTLQLENRLSHFSARRLQAALHPGALAAALFLLMRFELMGTAPLASALTAAGLAAGESAAMLSAGCILGVLRFPLNEIAIIPAIGCALALSAELACSLLPDRCRPASETRCSLGAGLGVLLPSLIHANGALLPSLQALACALIAAACAPFLLSAVAIRQERHRLTLQEKIGFFLLSLGAIAGLSRLFPRGAEAAACLFMLLLPSIGTTAGVLSGFPLSAGGMGMLKAASLALCTLAADKRLFASRWQRALAGCAACAILRFVIGAESIDPLQMLFAAAAYMLLPKALTERIDALFSQNEKRNCDPDRIAREVTHQTRRKLRALGDAFSELADGCAAPTGVPDEQELICEMRSRLCAGCPAYGECWAGTDNRAVRLLCRLLSDALSRVDAPAGMRVLFSDGEIPPDILRACRRGRMIPDRLGLLLRDFSEKRRSEIKRCATGQLMSIQFMQAAEILRNLAERQKEPLSPDDARLGRLRAALDAEGFENCDVLAFGMEDMEVHFSRAEATWTCDEVRRIAVALSRALGARFRPELREGELCFLQKPRLSVEIGAGCQSGVAGEVCGDSHLVRMLDGSHLLLAISDGMGSGEAAAHESLEALRLLWRFLEAGISRPLALETVNQQLLMRSGEEMFATADLCLLDLNTGVAEFTKLAACRTLILRGGELLQVEGGRLPLGILEGVQPNVSRVRLRSGDVLVMGSDGVMEAGDALMIERLARKHVECPPKQLAETLVREAGLRRAQSRQDDLTCICVQIQAAQ